MKNLFLTRKDCNGFIKYSSKSQIKLPENTLEGIKCLLLQNNFQKKPCQDLDLEVIFQESRTEENKIRYTEKRNRCMSPLRS